jgi:hypothetical protein
MRRIALLLVALLLIAGCETPTYQGLSSINPPSAEASPSPVPTLSAPSAAPSAVYNEPTNMPLRLVGWHYFTPTDRTFTIAVPGTVTESHTNQTYSGVAVGMNGYVSVYYKFAYSVVRGRFPAGTLATFSQDNLVQILDEAIDGIAASGGTISNKHTVTTADYVSIGQPAVRVTVTGDKLATEALIFFFGDDFYILGITHPLDQEAIDSNDTFFSSFHTLAPRT